MLKQTAFWKTGLMTAASGALALAAVSDGAHAQPLSCADRLLTQQQYAPRDPHFATDRLKAVLNCSLVDQYQARETRYIWDSKADICFGVAERDADGLTQVRYTVAYQDHHNYQITHLQASPSRASEQISFKESFNIDALADNHRYVVKTDLAKNTVMIRGLVRGFSSPFFREVLRGKYECRREL